MINKTGISSMIIAINEAKSRVYKQLGTNPGWNPKKALNSAVISCHFD